MLVQSGALIRDVIYALILWFLIIPLKVVQKVSNIKLKEFCLVISFILQYVGSAVTFKERFRKHKSDINGGKKRRGAANHFLECCTSESKFDNLKIQLIEFANVPDNLLEQKLW